MPRVTLTPRAVDRLVAETGKACSVYMDDHPASPRGFVLRCWATGAKAFYLLRTVRGTGRRPWVRIGPGEGTGLAAARIAAWGLAGDVSRDIDPNIRAREARQQARVEALRRSIEADEWTVRALLEAYVSAKSAGGISAVTLKNYRWDIGSIFAAPIASLPAREVVRDDVRRLLRSVEKRHSPTMAGRALTLLRAAYRWAMDEESTAVLPDGRSTVRPRVERDPSRRIEAEFPAVKAAMRRQRKRVLSDDEIVALWRGLDTAEPGLVRSSSHEPYPLPWLRWTIFPRLILLNGTRRGEAHQAKRSHLKLDGPEPTWFLPAAHRKGRAEGSRGARRELTIPLAPLSVRLFRELLAEARGRRDHRLDERVFTMSVGWVGGFVQDATGLRDVTLHDLRRTCSSGLQRLGAPPHVLSVVLGHSREAGSLATDSAYTHDRRVGEHRQWLRLWAEHVERLIGLRGPADVVPIRA